MKLKRILAVATSVLMAGTMLFTLAACKKQPTVTPEPPVGTGEGLEFKANYVGETTYEDGSLDYGDGQFSNPDSWGDDDGGAARS